MPDNHKSIWFGASMALLIVGLALVAAFWLATLGGRPGPGKLLAAGLATSGGALLLALWSAETTGQRRIARWLVAGILIVIALGFVVVAIQYFAALDAAYSNG